MTDDAGNGTSFLARRLRMKTEARRAVAKEPGRTADAPPPQPAVAVPVTEPSAVPEASPELPLPPVEALDADSDFSRYLAQEVSEGLRRAALRKLFHLPQFNITDGLDDYDEDFTTFEKLGELASYQKRRLLETEEPASGVGVPPQDSTEAALAESAAEGGGGPEPVPAPENAGAPGEPGVVPHEAPIGAKGDGEGAV